MKKLFSILLLVGVMSCSTVVKEQEFDYGQYIDNKVFTGIWTHESSGTIYIDDYHFKNGHQTLEIVSRSGHKTILYFKNVSFDDAEYGSNILGATLYYYKTGATKYSKRIRISIFNPLVYITDDSSGISLKSYPNNS